MARDSGNSSYRPEREVDSKSETSQQGKPETKLYLDLDVRGENKLDKKARLVYNQLVELAVKRIDINKFMGLDKEEEAKKMNKEISKEIKEIYKELDEKRTNEIDKKGLENVINKTKKTAYKQGGDEKKVVNDKLDKFSSELRKLADNDTLLRSERQKMNKYANKYLENNKQELNKITKASKTGISWAKKAAAKMEKGFIDWVRRKLSRSKGSGLGR